MADDLSALDNLRPEVLEAFAICDAQLPDHDSDGTPNAWYHVRAELLRLTQENADFSRAFADLSERHRACEAELAEMQQTFDLRWKADMRAIEQWRSAHPGNELTWPDQADLCVWLMAELAKLQERIVDAPVQVYGRDDWHEPLIGKRVALVKVED